MSIQFKKVSFKYKNNPPIINSLDLEIEKGDFISILGSNGSGKTSLAYLLNGLIPHAIDGEFDIEDCIFEKNWARHSGGAISGENEIKNCVFVNNCAYYNSGAVKGYNSNITNCTFWGNHYVDISGSAGAIGCNLTSSVYNCIIWNGQPEAAIPFFQPADNIKPVNVYNGGIHYSCVDLFYINRAGF